MRTLVICGTFDDNNGKPSNYMSQMFSGGENTSYYVNGGSWKELEKRFRELVESVEAVYWFPNIPNDKPKLVEEIKKINPKCLLVTSKNNTEYKYTHKDLVARALNAKSNLLVEFRKKGGVFTATLHDPLGNVFLTDESRPWEVRIAIEKRLETLRSFGRMRSIRVGPALAVPDEAEFFGIVKEQAEKFHTLIHAVNSDRLLGNASFRCERGFPGFRHEDIIFVSQRNIDKRFIGREGFVGVQQEYDTDQVKYYGDVKPSVDSPIQIRLFHHYTNIKYILHSHTYIKDAIITEDVIPCGAIEEFHHIVHLVPDQGIENFYINLRGHGSLVLAKDLNFMRSVPYISRPSPEEQKI